MTGEQQPDEPFSLAPHQVPAMPASTSWADVLRWMVAIMDHDDPELAVVASMLSQSILKDGLSHKQAKWGNDILARIHRRYRDGALDCQRRPIGDHGVGLSVVGGSEDSAS